jgi:hypothetical protein
VFETTLTIAHKNASGPKLDFQIVFDVAGISTVVDVIVVVLRVVEVCKVVVVVDVDTVVVVLFVDVEVVVDVVDVVVDVVDVVDEFVVLTVCATAGAVLTVTRLLMFISCVLADLVKTTGFPLIDWA